jgi:hypothetical protein
MVWEVAYLDERIRYHDHRHKHRQGTDDLPAPADVRHEGSWAAPNGPGRQLPGQRIVYDLSVPYGGYRTVSITGRNDERLLACRGFASKVIGSQLNDLIYVRNGTRDTVDCKAGNDVVLADRTDRIARNCETVRR